jgi:hypothetical protein
MEIIVKNNYVKNPFAYTMGLCKVTFAVFVLVEVLLAEMMENVIVR